MQTLQIPARKPILEMDIVRVLRQEQTRRKAGTQSVWAYRPA